MSRLDGVADRVTASMLHLARKKNVESLQDPGIWWNCAFFSVSYDNDSPTDLARKHRLRSCSVLRCGESRGARWIYKGRYPVWGFKRNRTNPMKVHQARVWFCFGPIKLRIQHERVHRSQDQTRRRKKNETQKSETLRRTVARFIQLQSANP